MDKDIQIQVYKLSPKEMVLKRSREMGTWVKKLADRKMSLLGATIAIGLLSLGQTPAPMRSQPLDSLSPTPLAQAFPSPRRRSESVQIWQRRSRSQSLPVNPLELTTPDPLLPGGLTRSLNASEQQRLAQALAELNSQAMTQLRSGDGVGAFETWNRELRLSRALGNLSEITALGRVGEQAWRHNQLLQVRLITQRLRAMETQLLAQRTPAQRSRADLSSTKNSELAALALAYQQVQAPGLALRIYQQLLAAAQQHRQGETEIKLLGTIAQLHLAEFNYPEAAQTYQELLNLAKSQGEQPTIGVALQGLVYAYEQTRQPQQAAVYQQQLLDWHQQNRLPQPAPSQTFQPSSSPTPSLPDPVNPESLDLALKLADQHMASGRGDLAEPLYLRIYTLAQQQQQIAHIGDALEKLGQLYRASDRVAAALKAYEILAIVRQQSGDLYGTMRAADQMGELYLQGHAYPEARAAFRRGLAASQELNYQVDHFTAQLQRVPQ